jgi:hypothetical protein
MLKISVRDMERCFGQIVVFIRGNGRMVYKMERVKYT